MMMTNDYTLQLIGDGPRIIPSIEAVSPSFG